MRAIGQDEFGGPEVLELIEVERPEPGPAEVLVRVHAAGVNPTDSWHRATGGLAGAVIRLGWDVSGVVEAVGLGVATLAPGDEVFGMPRHPLPAGTYAEYVTSPARHLVRKPTGLTHVQAAALPLAALTAWQALVDVAEVRPGHRVLIHAAAGGVGHLAVQIAKARGAYVIGTARSAKHDFLRGLGADELVDYTEADFETAVEPVDVVIDTIGGAYGPRSLRHPPPGRHTRRPCLPCRGIPGGRGPSARPARHLHGRGSRPGGHAGDRRTGRTGAAEGRDRHDAPPGARGQGSRTQRHPAHHWQDRPVRSRLTTAPDHQGTPGGRLRPHTRRPARGMDLRTARPAAMCRAGRRPRCGCRAAPAAPGADME